MHTRSPHRNICSPAAGRAAVAAAVLALAAVAPTFTTPYAARVVHAQIGANDLLLPDLRSAGPTTATLPTKNIAPVRRGFGPARRLGPSGIADFGFTDIHVANLTDSAFSVQLNLSLRDRNPRSFTRQLAAGGGATLHMAGEETISEGYWHATVRSTGAVGAIVRTGWVISGTSTSAYEGVRPATKLLVPLFVRGVDGVFSDYEIMNLDTDLEENTVTYQTFSPDTGELLSEWEDRLKPGAVTNLDAIEDGTSVSRLEANRPGDAWIGSLRIEAAGAVALQVYQNEAFEGGVSATGARPFSAAATTQYVPLVRRNYLGNSVIAVQNRDSKKANVTIAYRGAPDSPKHANGTVEQTFSIGPYGMHFVDLGTGRMGDVPAPAIDRGGGANTGFYGSAVITSDQPVVASVMETTGQPDRTRTNAAYNAFLASELGQKFIVPSIRSRSAARVTQFVVQNPGTGAAGVDVKITSAGGRSSTLATTVPPGEMRIVKLTEDTDGALAVITSDQAVAVLVYETPFGTPGAFKDAEAADTVAYAAPRYAGGSVPPTARSVSPTPTASATTATPTGPTPTGSIPTRTASATASGPRFRAFMPIVLRGSRFPGR